MVNAADLGYETVPILAPVGTWMDTQSVLEILRSWEWDRRIDGQMDRWTACKHSASGHECRLIFTVSLLFLSDFSKHLCVLDRWLKQNRQCDDVKLDYDEHILLFSEEAINWLIKKRICRIISNVNNLLLFHWHTVWTMILTLSVTFLRYSSVTSKYMFSRCLPCSRYITHSASPYLFHIYCDKSSVIQGQNTIDCPLLCFYCTRCHLLLRTLVHLDQHVSLSHVTHICWSVRHP